MRVMMLGWEFPPFFAGGIGVVCNELTRELCKRGDVDITYVMPFGPKEILNSHIKILVADNIISNSRIKVRKIPSLLTSPYLSSEQYSEQYESFKKNLSGDSDVQLTTNNTGRLYGKNLISEVYNFAEKTKLILEEEDFDLIHAHDWMTIPAGIAAKRVTGKPLIIHVHNTVYDRYLGDGGNKEREIEAEGFNEADRIVAISHLTKKTLVEKYGVDPEKIEVIHHARIDLEPCQCGEAPEFKKKDKVVLYAGRVTLQKGPEYFVRAAARVLEHIDDVKFVVAGTGDQLNDMINYTARLGISHKFVFHGFYTRQEGARFFEMADVFVMPSLSEPFGIVALEAMLKSTPSIISKQSGASELIRNALKIDFWDVDKMANAIIALLEHKALNNTISDEGLNEVNGLNWDEPARRCVDVYQKVLVGRTRLD